MSGLGTTMKSLIPFALPDEALPQENIVTTGRGTWYFSGICNQTEKKHSDVPLLVGSQNIRKMPNQPTSDGPKSSMKQKSTRDPLVGSHELSNSVHTFTPERIANTTSQ